MKTSKLISAALAAMLAVGTFAVIPSETGLSTAIVSEADTSATLSDFKATPGNRSVTLSWTRLYSAYAYSVYYRKSGDTEWKSYKTSTTPGCIITGLDPDTSYDFEVIAYDRDYNLLAYGFAYDVTPSSKNNTSENGFVISTDSDGLKYVASYKGSGGDIVIPSNVSYIGEEAFMENTSITSVTIPSKCTSIGNAAFKDCIKLKKVIVESNVSVSADAFSYCFSLESIEFKKSVRGIGEYAFLQCQGLKKLSIAEGSSNFTIYASAFRGCISLETVKLPKNCAKICPLAFLNCFSLREITVPSTTKFEYSGDNAHIGYFYAGKTAANAWDEKYYFGKADNKTSVYYETLSKNPVTNNFVQLGVLYYGIKKYTPAKVTMVVTKGSDAEKYAKKYDITYKYASGSSSSSSSGKLAAPENFRATKKTTTSISLAWDAVDGADAYAVYMYNSKTGKYEKYKTVQGAKCTVSGLTKGTKYKFKVYALNKVNGKYRTGNASDILTVSTKSAQ